MKHMRITVKQLRRIIKEEVTRVLSEQEQGADKIIKIKLGSLEMAVLSDEENSNYDMNCTVTYVSDGEEITQDVEFKDRGFSPIELTLAKGDLVDNLAEFIVKVCGYELELPDDIVADEEVINDLIIQLKKDYREELEIIDKDLYNTGRKHLV